MFNFYIPINELYNCLLGMSSPSGLINVFEPGLIRGSARLNHQPHKKYFYVEHPVEGWRVYLRMACFIHEAGSNDPRRFLVVKRKDATPSSNAWEPPKGQMEGKDAKPIDAPLIELMAENVRRETLEEAKITKIKNLRYTGLVVQSREKEYPSNHYFQYHLFQAITTSDEIQKAQETFKWLNEHPKAFSRMRSDVREKDALTWFDPKKTKMMGRWSPSIVTLYLDQSKDL
jgi:8-oxo-dGTP pyrophosphatase MutT (NUDIX family)